MDAELKTCFDKWEASLNALCCYLLDTTAGVTRPVPAISVTDELAIIVEGMAPASSSSSASPTLSTVWENGSPVAQTSCVNSIEGGHVLPVDVVSTAIIMEVATLTGFKPAQDDTIQLSGVTVMAREGVATVHVTCSTKGPSHDANTPALASTLAATPTSPMATVGVIHVLTSVAASGGTLDNEPNGVSSPANIIRQPWVVQWMVASSPPSPSKYSDRALFKLNPSRSIRSEVPIHRPIHWHSFMGFHADRDETRPQPWPSFREINDCEFPSDDEKVSGRCMFYSSSTKNSEWICLDDVLLFLEYWGSAGSWLSVGSRLSAGCSLVVCCESSIYFLTGFYNAIKFVAGLLSTMDWHPLDFLGRSTVTACLPCIQEPDHYFYSSQPKESLIRNSMRRSNSLYDQFSCAIWDASYWPGNFVTESEINIVFISISRALRWLVSCICGPPMSSPFTVLCDEWVLSPWDSGPQSDVSYDQFACTDQHTSCVPRYFFTYRQLQVTAASFTRHLFPSKFLSYFRQVVMLELQFTGSGSHFVYLRALRMDKSGIEGASISSIINVNPCMLKWSESIIAYPDDLAPYCSNISHTSAGIFCDRKLEFNNWVSCMEEEYTESSSGIKTGLHFLVVPFQSAALKYMDLWWFTNATLTEIMNIFSVVQMDVTSSTQLELMFNHAYQHSSFGWEQLVQAAHWYCITVTCGTTLYDPIVDWCMHIQYLFIGVMHMVCESILAPTMFSFARDNLTYFSNSEIQSCALLIGFIIGNAAQIRSEISNKDICALAACIDIVASVDNGVATRKHAGIDHVCHTEVPCYTAVCNAALPATFQEVSLHILWDPRSSTSCRLLWFSTYYDQESFKGGRDLIATTVWDQWLLETDHINEHRLQWDPGRLWCRLGVKPNFKEGGMLGSSSTSKCTTYMGWPFGPQRRPGPCGQLPGLHATYTPGEATRKGIQVGSGEWHGGSSLPSRL